jgi:hypothetical protein
MVRKPPVTRFQYKRKRKANKIGPTRIVNASYCSLIASTETDCSCGMQSTKNNSVQQQQAPLDLEASPIQGQLASAVLDRQGNLVRGHVSTHDCSILYQMLVEAGSLPECSSSSSGDFSRITVTFASVRYVVALDDTYIYIVQARA